MKYRTPLNTQDVTLFDSNSSKRLRGFTLMEVMIVVLIIGIMVNMVSPIGRLLSSFRLDFYSQRLYTSSKFARSEAIKRGDIISVCRSIDGASCDNTGTDWSTGWIIFNNPNDNDTVDTGEEVLRVFNAINPSIRITWNMGNRLTFWPRGNADASGNFTVCVNGVTTGETRTVTTTPTGQIRKASGTGTC